MPHVTLPQGTVHYVDEGPADGPVLVLVHGLLVDARLWRKVIPPLVAGGHRVIAPDLPLGAHRTPLAPGADRSPAGVARLVADLLEALDLRDVTLVGSDSGGAISQLVAADHPERLARLVLLSCDAFDNFPPKAFRPLVALASRERLLRAAVAPLRFRVTWRLPIVFGWVTKRPIDDPAVARVWADQVTGDPATFADAAAFLRGTGAGVTEAVARRLPAFTKPVLILWAREDRLFPPAHAERLAALFADARVQWVDDSYAFLSEDQPGVTAEALRDFVAQTPTGSTPAGIAPVGR